MEREETAQNTQAKDSRSQRHRYISVRDSRNRKVRGLWQRNGAYYVQFWVAGVMSSGDWQAVRASTWQEPVA